MGLFMISRIYNAIPSKSQNRTMAREEKTKSVIIASFIVLKSRKIFSVSRFFTHAHNHPANLAIIKNYRHV